MRLPPRLLLAAVQVAILPTTGWGQVARLNTLSLERLYDEGGAYTVAFTYRRTDIGRSHLGLDFGVGLIPAALPARVVMLPLDVGVARAVSVGPACILLRGGAASFVLFGARNTILPGGQAGLALLLPFRGRSRIRIDANRRFYFSSRGGTIPMWSVGVGVSAPGRVSSD